MTLNLDDFAASSIYRQSATAIRIRSVCLIVAALTMSALGCSFRFGIPFDLSSRQYLIGRPVFEASKVNGPSQPDVGASPSDVQLFDRRLSATSMTTFSQPIRTLTAQSSFDRLFVGTSGDAGLYFVSMSGAGSPAAVAASLGDSPTFGSAEIAAASIVDFDGDGKDDLAVLTSQVNPRGRPVFAAWRIDGTPTLIGMTRPDVKSSWAHCLVAEPWSSETGGRRLLSAFCGYGEIISFTMFRRQSVGRSWPRSRGNERPGRRWNLNATADDEVASGRDVIATRIVNDYEFSGESIGWMKLSANDDSAVDRSFDGDRHALVVAVGFATGEAELKIYRPETNDFSDSVDKSASLERSASVGKTNSAVETNDDERRRVLHIGSKRFRQTHSIDENGRFANVRFKSADLDGDGGDELYAWWSTELNGGLCEFIRYDLWPTTIERQVIREGTGELWPLESQIEVFSGFGKPELWFATYSGDLSRYDPSTNAVELIARTDAEGGFGPVSVVNRLRCYVGQGRRLIQIDLNE